ncbi:HAMP domain-containing histidine kinase [Dysgonomonas sp. Marseille-P4677]|uniref:sensor histidine kinase n=1 Tax=Dysgonomonas sp. Marseille-P4677 TaxID=2364790 RepID=UPI001912574D|nr:HAMP domain-containing sensor histidine kinase [Dysgonomonas sp. Marseille-P4677]MBK5722468.1 HAMP domain-containing histidine kinase [Dysgonomonas sp. Marseille-P4677]
MTLIKLIRKYLIIASLFVLLIGCISHLLIFRFFIHYSADSVLIEQQQKIESFVAKHDTLPLVWKVILQPARIERRQIDNPDVYPAQMFKDTLLYSEETGSITPYRQLYFVVSYKGEYHLVNINQPTMISDDLFYAIISSLFILIFLLIFLTYVISYLLKRNIWIPLNKNLRELHNYDLKANTALNLENPGIKEFDEINDVIMRMVEKINADYENSRIFAEDASHEMQTPLSIIKSKLDLIIQDDSLKDRPDQIQSMQAISRAVTRLSKLNRSLLLITKINNNQFEDKENVNIADLLRGYLEDLEELMATKDLTIKHEIGLCYHSMNPILSEIMISNLLSNAIRHNVVEGEIKIILNAEYLSISNTCIEEVDEDVNLFNRMIQRSRTKESSGLGLNIVKSICEKSNLNIYYDYPSKNVFRIIVAFK